jgi:hypothetical protein
LKELKVKEVDYKGKVDHLNPSGGKRPIVINKDSAWREKERERIA